MCLGLNSIQAFVLMLTVGEGNLTFISHQSATYDSSISIYFELISLHSDVTVLATHRLHFWSRPKVAAALFMPLYKLSVTECSSAVAVFIKYIYNNFLTVIH